MKLYQKILAGAAGTAGAGVVAWRTMFPWIEHDLKLVKIGSKMLKIREEVMKTLIIDKFEKHAQETPKKTFIIYEDNMYTYEFVDQMACRVANIARSWGLGPRDCVAMMIQNEPAFVWTFLGLQKLGITAALINYNLKMQPLVQSVLAAEPKFLIVGSGDALLEAVTEVLEELGNLQVYIQGLGSLPAPQGMCSFDHEMLSAPPISISPVIRSGITMEDICCYIYTSGTTGNPKPAYISHERAVFIGCVLILVDLCETDTLYTVLPLYHSSGGGIGLYGALVTGNPKPAIITHSKTCRNCTAAPGIFDLNSEDIYYIILPMYHSAAALGYFGVIHTGATMLLRKKFSATHFWEDCRRHNVTVIQYIGELFRYLLGQPPSDLDAKHKVRAAFGNGLRKDIWNEVNQRFQIPQICEFFGATEGTSILLNVSNKPGAIGRLSPFLRMIDSDPKALVKFDYASAMPIRDKNGCCIKVGIDEPGLFLSKVPDNLIKDGQFSVYRSSQESNEKKLVRDAFQPGDIYFNYGDVFVMDKDYFLYFQDRIGDTFRWKGENVSTTELANVITTLPFVHDANVYGVTIPGHDGRAGMVAITLNEGCKLGQKELKELYVLVVEALPTYARPLFVRHLDEAIITGTFKQRKVELLNEGFDLNIIKDPMYFLDSRSATYSPLTASDLSTFLTSKL